MRRVRRECLGPKQRRSDDREGRHARRPRRRRVVSVAHSDELLRREARVARDDLRRRRVGPAEALAVRDADRRQVDLIDGSVPDLIALQLQSVLGDRAVQIPRRRFERGAGRHATQLLHGEAGGRKPLAEQPREVERRAGAAAAQGAVGAAVLLPRVRVDRCRPGASRDARDVAHVVHQAQLVQRRDVAERDGVAPRAAAGEGDAGQRPAGDRRNLLLRPVVQPLHAGAPPRLRRGRAGPAAVVPVAGSRGCRCGRCRRGRCGGGEQQQQQRPQRRHVLGLAPASRRDRSARCQRDDDAAAAPAAPESSSARRCRRESREPGRFETRSSTALSVVQRGHLVLPSLTRQRAANNRQHCKFPPNEKFGSKF